MAGLKRRDSLVPTGRQRDVGGKKLCFGGRERYQLCEISGGVAIGHFPDWAWGSRQEMGNN